MQHCQLMISIAIKGGHPPKPIIEGTACRGSIFTANKADFAGGLQIGRRTLSSSELHATKGLYFWPGLYK
jgi:hypothetical protein